MSELNKRQWALYNFLKDHGDTWITQHEVATLLFASHGIYETELFMTTQEFHFSNTRKLMTADIRAINESAVIQKVIISSGKGIKIANKEEFDRYIRKEIMSSVRRLMRAKLKAKKGNLDGQTRITFGQYERDTIKAFIDSDKEVGERLRRVRLEKGLKASAVCLYASKCGVRLDEPMLSRFENGYCIPNGKTLAQIAKIYGVTPEYLLTGDLPPDEEINENNGLQVVENGV